MVTIYILFAITLVLAVLNIYFILKAAGKPADPFSIQLEPILRQFSTDLRGTENNLKNEFAIARKEQADHAKGLREEVGNQLGNFTRIFSEQLTALTSSIELKFTAFQATIDRNDKDSRKELRENLSDFLGAQKMQHDAGNVKLAELRTALETAVNRMQEGNEKKLEEMRKTVDEKLNDTLEKRLGESFKLVSERLEAVHKGLGDMQNLASSVGDLKKVMNNVKSRGVMGEYQLQNLLEDLLTNDQYEKNVRTKVGSGAVVEFAVRMPHGANFEKRLWLPIDSKFPKEDYEALVDAYESGDTDKIAEHRKAFVRGIRKNAQDIKEKYIDPPNTTEYGIMFLPYESLFAEVLRMPGLFDQLQKEYKITITGPTTPSALLSSLQMGFRTLAIEKRSSEVWDLLGSVKTEFRQFGDILSKTKKKLIEATNVLETSEIRTRAIEKKLRTVQELPQEQSNRLLGSDSGSEQTDVEEETA
jgi:DNA recombination protein RmuC